MEDRDVLPELELVKVVKGENAVDFHNHSLSFAMVYLLKYLKLKQISEIIVGKGLHSGKKGPELKEGFVSYKR